MFTAAQAAQKRKAQQERTQVSFTAAQAAQKWIRRLRASPCRFTAAQAAQKKGFETAASLMKFTAAQAAQKRTRTKASRSSFVVARTRRAIFVMSLFNGCSVS